MLDIETLGDISNSVIVSIGAIKFDINTGKLGKSFYRIIDIQNCLDLGFKVTGGTIQWWMKKGEEARSELTVKGLPIHKVLSEFSNFVSSKDILWSRGVRFDIALLTNAYNICKVEIPWDFRNERCVRTLEAFRPEIYKNTLREGVAHNSLDDCKHQIKYCSKIWNNINNQL
jgi:hypothetical protein